MKTAFVPVLMWFRALYYGLYGSQIQSYLQDWETVFKLILRLLTAFPSNAVCNSPGRGLSNLSTFKRRCWSCERVGLCAGSPTSVEQRICTDQCEWQGLSTLIQNASVLVCTHCLIHRQHFPLKSWWFFLSLGAFHLPLFTMSRYKSVSRLKIFGFRKQILSYFTGTSCILVLCVHVSYSFNEMETISHSLVLFF